MSEQRKTKRRPRKAKLGDQDVCFAADGSHPAQVSGLFQNDPTFADFRKILREQREEDYRRASEDIDALLRQSETRACSSSIPTRSRSTKTRTRSSVQE
jgi:hypothetical protein